MKYRNPIIPGFYPDPSICRAGDDFYLVNSSFEFFPGVPLYHSRDLVCWEQLGSVLTRKSQLPLSGCGTSGGIFAPTIREHNGRFYMITTNVNKSSRGFATANFIVHTDDIRGEWSDPAFLDHEGIDPSLFWDDDGNCYYVGTHFGEKGQCIGQFQLNPDTGEHLSETRPLWYGTGGRCPEGPHMYKKDGWYYLMIAEGGTEYGHMETIARSRSVWGPFESCPHNPILTHRDLMLSFETMANPNYVEFEGTGHADLVDDKDGGWWLVFHAVRPSKSQLHHIGRETMLVPVEWVDGWPVVNGGRAVEALMETRDTPGVQLADGLAEQGDFSLEEDFTQMQKLSPSWAYLRNPHEESYRFDRGLVLTAGPDCLDGMGSPSFVGIRQRQFRALVEAELEPASQDRAQSGLTVFHTNEHHYDLMVTGSGDERNVILRKRVCDMVTESTPVALPGSGPVALKIQSHKWGYEFFAGTPGETLRPVGQGLSQLLSTEVMAGTFTGCFFGLFCQGSEEARARFSRFRCQYITF
ncbi:glycoside hydrolase family 43 protein [Acutalibacter sp. 1XD8-33]|uniref:glycoside hydrolase family 43 protein n=1 Tax=Acutalibacter sp. 1XD8-33 TaxID=2320081 RepID=UPI000EA31B47|nr:glycoside hydrolase family 43 protein [Acutalibacter sp. 1XD8-33]RKJ41762.1 glycoside hydrolase family 43 protein [Acutalibacter sp. 1XD8-33]